MAVPELKLQFQRMGSRKFTMAKSLTSWPNGFAIRRFASIAGADHAGCPSSRRLRLRFAGCRL